MSKPLSRMTGRLSRWGCLALSGAVLMAQLACTQLRVTTALPSQPPADSPRAEPPLAELSSVETSSSLGMSEQQNVAGIQFQAFRYATDAQSQRLFQGNVLTQLWLERNGRWELVHREQSPQWNRSDLVPGKYLLEVVEIRQHDRPSQPNEDKVITFEVKPQESAVVRLVVKKVPWGRVAIVAFSVVIVIGLVLTLVLLRDNLPEIKGRPERVFSGSRSDYNLPPPPRAPAPRGGGAGSTMVFVPPRLHLAGQLWWDVTDVVVDSAYAFDTWSPGYAAHAPAAPRLESFTPPGRMEPDPQLRLYFDREMNGASLSPSTLVLVDAAEKVLACGVYMEDRQTAVVHPLRPLAAGSYRLVVRGPWIFDAQGQPLQQTFQLPFEMGLEAVPSPEVLNPAVSNPAVPSPTDGVPAPHF
ncbi:MAG: hypothetical protein ACKO6N_03615 [Myxococcota bacterium]